VSARLAKTALAAMSGKDLQDIEEVWHGLKLPYLDLFAWLDGRTERPDIDHAARFHPLMLSNPIDEDKDLDRLLPQDFAAEWKWDGIRVQLILGTGTASLFSRTGDDIANAFPDIVDNVSGRAVLDGELLVGHDFDARSFNDLQQRLNKKVASARHLKELPAFIRVYDMLFDGETDIRTLSWTDRRARLEEWFAQNPQSRLDISEVLPFADWQALAQLRRQGADEHGHEGVMVKLRSSPYVPGRPKGYWFKWKRDPNVVDAVLMYAQRGHGKRSSFYSDYTFGVWKGNEIVPIGKAYFGFTDEELKQLDKWIRANTLQVFGPVREVKKELVFEVAFDSAQPSARHKSGVALRFPSRPARLAQRSLVMSSRSINEKLVELERKMAAAAEAMDFEEAARLRNQIALIKGDGARVVDDGTVTVTVSQPPPGAMGLGTQVPVRQPPKGWVKPRKPDPLTTNVKGKR
jgi:DNA ligase-1